MSSQKDKRPQMFPIGATVRLYAYAQALFRIETAQVLDYPLDPEYAEYVTLLNGKRVITLHTSWIAGVGLCVDDLDCPGCLCSAVRKPPCWHCESHRPPEDWVEPNQCTCGAAKCGSDKHSNWCDLDRRPA